MCSMRLRYKLEASLSNCVAVASFVSASTKQSSISPACSTSVCRVINSQVKRTISYTIASILRSEGAEQEEKDLAHARMEAVVHVADEREEQLGRAIVQDLVVPFRATRERPQVLGGVDTTQQD
uniref:Uncharacterized protein n=1 Tax=Globisporangium ultimum (strain ATCC 200006 / CBS 805.95 / DAOM BR144) TaxID=431595 RepID=K3WHG8_GLOUD